MKGLFLIVSLVVFSAITAFGQNIDTSFLKINPLLVKCIQLRDMPKHIGDTICVYGHVHDYKALPDSNKLIVNIDSASHGRVFTVELRLPREAIPYLIEQITNNSIQALGIITGNRNNFKVMSYVIVPENKDGDMLAGFNSLLLTQKHRSDKHKVKIISVTLSPPNQ
jgi:hypothetical protein